MTIPDIIIRAEISQYLSVIAITKGGLNGSGIPSHLPSLIYQVRKNVAWMWLKNPSDPALIGMGNYLYAITGRFGLEASYRVNSGGTVAGVGADQGLRSPLIGVVGNGGPYDPVAGESTFQNGKLVGLGSTNNGQIQIVIGVTIQWNFGDNKSFEFDSVTGIIDLSYIPGNTFIAGSGIYVDCNQ